MAARRQRCRLAAVLAAFAATGCTPVVRYTNALVSDQEGRTWFTRIPATIGGTVGFTVGVPVDVAILPATWVVYKTQPRETRDPLSVFMFPSFVLWKVGALVGTPFDLVEWLAWRSWQPPRVLTQQERESIENEWDSRGTFKDYPVTPIHPLPAAAPERPPGG